DFFWCGDQGREYQRALEAMNWNTLDY
ncbi:MAG: hypothetical protein RL234_1436, partial [Pseudomonadota bacterium]